MKPDTHSPSKEKNPNLQPPKEKKSVEAVKCWPTASEQDDNLGWQVVIMSSTRGIRDYTHVLGDRVFGSESEALQAYQDSLSKSGE